MEVVKVKSIYDREDNDCCVVRHPSPDMHDEWLAVYNTKTGLFKLEDGRVARYHRSALSSAGYDASDDSAWIREVPHGTPRRYGPYTF
jgi:hypothetical protein